MLCKINERLLSILVVRLIEFNWNINLSNISLGMSEILLASSYIPREL